MDDLKKINLSRLDHLRFFAATILIFHHFRGKLPPAENGAYLKGFLEIWLEGGSTGVTLFLVLSGFLFCILTDAGRKSVSYRGFIKNRVIRIFPLLILFFFIILCVNRQASTPIDILRLLTLQLNTGNQTTGWGNEFFPIGPIWTIGVEFQFYLIFPLVIILLDRFGPMNMVGWIIIILLAKFLIVYFHGVGMYYNLYHTIVGRLDQFLIGILLGHFHIYRGYSTILDNDLNRCLLLLASLVCLTILCQVDRLGYKWLASTVLTFEALSWACLIYAYISFSFKFNRYLDKVLSYLGSLSYSMYLWHLSIGIFVLQALSFPESTNIYTSIKNCAIYIFPATLLVSAVTYHFIEKPFLSMKTAYLGKKE